MTDQTNEELLELVKSLAQRVESLETEIKSIKVLNTEFMPEEVLVAIAAGVAAYLGHRAKRRQAHFTTSRSWQTTTRGSQHVHTPLHLR